MYGFTYLLYTDLITTEEKSINDKIEEILKLQGFYKRDNLYLTKEGCLRGVAELSLTLQNKLSAFRGYIQSANLIKISEIVNIGTYL